MATCLIGIDCTTVKHSFRHFNRTTPYHIPSKRISLISIETLFILFCFNLCCYKDALHSISISLHRKLFCQVPSEIQKLKRMFTVGFSLISNCVWWQNLLMVYVDLWIAKCHAICDSTKENCKTNSYCFTSFFFLRKKVKHNLWLSKHVPIFLIHKKVVKMRYKRSFEMPKKCMRTKKKNLRLSKLNFAFWMCDWWSYTMQLLF